MEEYLDKALERAQTSFWISVQNNFPLVISGDLSPDIRIPLEKLQKKAIREWIKNV